METNENEHKSDNVSNARLLHILDTLLAMSAGIVQRHGDDLVQARALAETDHGMVVGIARSVHLDVEKYFANRHRVPIEGMSLDRDLVLGWISLHTMIGANLQELKRSLPIIDAPRTRSDLDGIATGSP